MVRSQRILLKISQNRQDKFNRVLKIKVVANENGSLRINYYSSLSFRETLWSESLMKALRKGREVGLKAKVDPV